MCESTIVAHAHPSVRSSCGVRVCVRTDNVYITPRKINMEPNNGPWEDDFPFNWVILRFHVNFQGCIYLFMCFQISTLYMLNDYLLVLDSEYP